MSVLPATVYFTLSILYRLTTMQQLPDFSDLPPMINEFPIERRCTTYPAPRVISKTPSLILPFLWRLILVNCNVRQPINEEEGWKFRTKVGKLVAIDLVFRFQP